jgi:glycerophosphoryl diester phosphodiesterase
LWLQGEADATTVGLATHEAELLKLVDDLRGDLGIPDLPFLVCTIGEMKQPGDNSKRVQMKGEMNRLLLSLSTKRPHVDCVDARALTTHLGDFVHFDTAAQNEIGRRYARRFLALSGHP